jgi:hypothetical protein
VGAKGKAYFLVNTSSKEYRGECTFDSTGEPVALDPETGKEHRLSRQMIDNTNAQVGLSLSPFASLFVRFS